MPNGSISRESITNMFDWLHWFAQPNNSKTILLVLLSVTFFAILMYLFVGTKRTKRLESYKYIPFQDDHLGDPESESSKVTEKVTENECKRR